MLESGLSRLDKWWESFSVHSSSRSDSIIYNYILHLTEKHFSINDDKKPLTIVENGFTVLSLLPLYFFSHIACLGQL